MDIFKTITRNIFFFLIYLLFPGYLFAQYHSSSSVDTSSKLTDSAKTRQYRITNKNFNGIYNQNLQLTNFGNEYFDPHKTLLVNDLVANFVILNTPKLPIYFVFTPQVNLRLFAAFGSPVKSPSYMPGGTLYFRLNNDMYRPSFFTVAYTHHSNGIEGPTANHNGTINTDSGKFTTNFYTFTYHTGRRTDYGDIIINRYDALGLELHAALVGLGYAHALAGKYGFVRVNGNWMYNIDHSYHDAIDKDKKVFKNWQRVQLDFEYIADKYDDYNNLDLKKRLNINLKYYYQFPFMQNVSFLVGAGYRGQDNYNIFFQDSYPYLLLGFASGLSFDFRK